MEDMAKISKGCLYVTVPLFQAIKLGFLMGLGLTTFNILFNFISYLLTTPNAMPPL